MVEGMVPVYFEGVGVWVPGIFKGRGMVPVFFNGAGMGYKGCQRRGGAIILDVIVVECIWSHRCICSMIRYLLQDYVIPGRNFQDLSNVALSNIHYAAQI